MQKMMEIEKNEIKKDNDDVKGIQENKIDDISERSKNKEIIEKDNNKLTNEIEDDFYVFSYNLKFKNNFQSKTEGFESENKSENESEMRKIERMREKIKKGIFVSISGINFCLRSFERNQKVPKVFHCTLPEYL
jgi:hypothetical protein